MKSVRLVMPYYGTLPDFMEAYLESLRGKNIDVLFFTDLEISTTNDKVKVIRLSLDEVRALAERKLGTKIGLDTPKKFCDFKPMYGKIFEDYLKEYDYWAFGDCDLIYGNKLNDWLDDVLGGDYDVISMQKYWLSGPLTILRNCERINRLYERTSNWRDIVAMPGTVVGFDEFCGEYHEKVASGEMTYAETRQIQDNFTSVVFMSDDVKLYHENVITEKVPCDFVVKYDYGSLTLNNSEIVCFHYVIVKIRRYFKTSCIRGARTNRFFIDDTGFHRSLFGRKIVGECRKMAAVISSLRRNGLRRFIHA